MNLKSIDFTADQKLNKWDFISDVSAKNLVHEHKIPNKTEQTEQTRTINEQMNKTIKQKMFRMDSQVSTNQKSRQDQPMRKRRQYQNFQKNWDKKWNDQNQEIRSLAPIGSEFKKMTILDSSPDSPDLNGSEPVSNRF